jgi:hypothetical protein
LDDEEKASLLETLGSFSNRDFELGEVLKSSTLPLCDPPPRLSFTGRTYRFAGTFIYGQRKVCERAVVERGGVSDGLSRKTEVLVIGAYNYGRRLKTLKGLTPYEFICKTWTKEPERFRLDPTHQSLGLNT